MEQRIKSVMSAVFRMPAEAISDSASPHELPAWDSLKHMDLIMALEQEFGIHFDDNELPLLTSIGVITAVITGHLEAGS